jgi:hypothetical protein
MLRFCRASNKTLRLRSMSKRRSVNGLSHITELLEDRSLLSAFYDLSVVATTGSEFANFGDLVSINNAGVVAFVAYKNGDDPSSRDSGLYTAQTSHVLTNINPDFTNSEGRDFGRAVAINDSGILTARDRVGTLFEVRQWDSTGKDAYTDIATTGPGLLTGGKYSALQTFTDINNKGDVAFVALKPGGEFKALMLVLNGTDPNKPTQLDVSPSGVAGGPTPRPQLTDDGRVLSRLSNGNIVLFNPDGSLTNFATSQDGFFETGAAPGITADGKVVVFTGNRGRGSGVFASYYFGGTRQIVRIAGEGFDDWTDFDLNSAVRVSGSMQDAYATNPNERGDRGVTVAFEGTNSVVGHGIYSARVSFFGLSSDIYDDNAAIEVRVSGAAPVALVGETLPFGNSAIKELEPYGMNDMGRGEMAFWAKTGTQEVIVRALPQQVVYIDTVPGLHTMGGYTEANLSLLDEVGLTKGWDGTLIDALGIAGYQGNPFAMAGLVREKVQELYSDTGARVRIVSTPPVQVMRTATDTAGAVLKVNGIPIRNGTYQTVQVGVSQAPQKNHGLSAPVYTRAGGLDFFNQVVDDTALVFANQILTSNLYAGPIETLSANDVAAGLAYVIAHESGHNFGLGHTSPLATDDIMHGGSNPMEFDEEPEFSHTSRGLDGKMGVALATENPTQRLIFSTGGAYQHRGDPPQKELLSKNREISKSSRFKAIANLTNGSLSVAHLLAGTVASGLEDQIPIFQDVGSGTLSGLLSSSVILAPKNGQLILIGSTDGTAPDLIAIPASQAGVLNLSGLSMAALVSDERLRSSVGEPLNLYYVPASGTPELIGTMTVEGEPEATVYLGDGLLVSGDVIGMGETVPHGGSLTKTLLIQNTGAAALTLGQITISGPGFTVSPPAKTVLSPGEETTITVTLSDATAGIGITGSLKIASNSPGSPLTLTVRGTVDGRPRITEITRIDNGTGPVKVAIDFSGALQSGAAGVAANYAVSLGNESVSVASATYTQTGSTSRVTLILSASADTLPSGDYSVRIDGTKVLTASGAPLETTRENLIAHQIGPMSVVTIGSNGSGQAVVLSGPELTGNSPPRVIQQGDFNSDGIGDYVALADLSHSLLVHLGQPEGGYTTEVHPLTGPFEGFSSNPQSMLATDWNDDGALDLIILDQVSDFLRGQLQQMFVLLNDGRGHFDNAPETPIPIAPDVLGPILAVDDFTGDGQKDIALGGPVVDGSAHSTGSGSVAIYGKDPFLGYSQIATISLEHSGWTPQSAVLADLNGDGRQDLVVSTTGFFMDIPKPVIFLNTASGLVLGDDLQYGGEEGNPAVADFTGDGKLDIAIVSDYYSNLADIQDGGVISLLRGDGAGHFTWEGNTLLNRRGVATVAFGDVNQDGIADLITRAAAFEQIGFNTTPENSLWVLLGTGGGDFDLTTPLIPLSQSGVNDPGNFVISDVNGDGFSDISVGNLTDGQIGLFLNEGAGHFAPSKAAPITTSETGFYNTVEVEPTITIADLNHDGIPDQLRLVLDYNRTTQQAVDILWGTADGKFEVVSSVYIDSNARSSHNQYLGYIGSLRVGDLNHDGWPDLVVGGYGNGGPIQIFLGVNGRDFVTGSDYLIDAGNGLRITNGDLVDVNGDGNLDYVGLIFNGGAYGLGVLFGNGTGKLVYSSNTYQQLTALVAQRPVIADFNGDHKLDIAVGTFNSNSEQKIQIFNGLGNGRFVAGQSLARDLYDQKGQLFFEDLNGDGFGDLLSPGSGTVPFEVFLGSATGNFTTAPDLTIPLLSDIAQLKLADMTGDGKDDLVIARGSYFNIGRFTTLLVYPGEGQGHFGEPQEVDTHGDWPVSLALLPIASIIDAGLFSITHPVLSIPAGALDITTSTRFEQNITINPLPLIEAFTHDSVMLSVSGPPLHGTVIIQNNATPGNSSDDTFVYQVANGYIGSDTFSFLVGDGRGGTATGTVTITVLPKNAGPVISVSSKIPKFSGLSPAKVIDTAATVVDSDSSNFQNGKLVIRVDGYLQDKDHFSLENEGTGPGQVSIEFDDADDLSGVVSYAGQVIGRAATGPDGAATIRFTSAAATPAVVQAILQRISYFSYDDQPTADYQRTFTIIVTDGDGAVSTATKPFLWTVPGSAAAPIVTLSAGTVSYLANSAAVVVDSAALISDADSPNLADGSLTVDFNDFSFPGDRLAIQSSGTGAGQINLAGTTIKLDSVAIGTYSGGFSTNSPLVVHFNENATPAAVQALLRRITYSFVGFNPESNSRQIRFMVDDGENGVSVPAIREVSITRTDGRPEITVSGSTTFDPFDHSPIIVDSSITVTDPDSTTFNGGSVTVDFDSIIEMEDRLAIQSSGTGAGQINLSGTTVKLGSVAIGTYAGGFSTNSPLVISFNSNATPAAAQALFRQITYAFAGSTPGTNYRQIRFIVDDGTDGISQAALQFVQFVHTAIPPVLTTSAGSTFYPADRSAVRIDSGITVTDPDSLNFGGGFVTIDFSSFSNDGDRLSIQSAGIGAGQISLAGADIRFGNVSIGTLSDFDSFLEIDLNRNATVAAVQALLRQVTYSFVGTDPEVDTREIRFSVDDGTGTFSEPAIRLIQFPSANAAPQLTTSSGTTSYPADHSAVRVDSVITVADADSQNFNGGSLTVDFASFTNSGDRLAIQSAGTGAGQINLTGTTVKFGSLAIGTFTGGVSSNSRLVVNFNSSASVAAVQALLRQITYSFVGTDPEFDSRDIQFVVDDGKGGLSDPAIRTIQFAQTNAAPEVTTSSGTTSYPADRAAVLIDNAITVTDSDSANFGGGSLAVDVLLGLSSEDRVAIRNVGTGPQQINLSGNTIKLGAMELGTYTGGFTSSAPLVVAFNTNATPANVELLLRQITFQIDSATPTNTDRVIRFFVTDGDGAQSAAATKTVVVAITSNEKPVVQLSSTTATFSKAGPAVAFDSQLTVSGAATFGGGVLTISINDVNTGKKKFDVFNLSALGVIGTSRGTQLVNGRSVTIFDLTSGVTAALVQNALRHVTFQTSGRGLKFSSRTAQIQVTTAQADSSATVTKTLQVSKKKVKAQ